MAEYLVGRLRLVERRMRPVVGSPFVSVLAYGAVGDGTTDDTVAIQNAVNAAVAAGKCVWFPAGHYKVTMKNAGSYYRAIDLPSYARLLLDAAAYVELATCAPPGFYYIMAGQNKTGIQVTGGRFVGERAGHADANEHGMGLGFEGCSYVRVVRGHFSQCAGDGLYFGGYATGYVNCSNVFVDTVTCYQNRRNGMSVVACDGGDFYNVTGQANGTGTGALSPKNGIDVEANPNYMTRNLRFYDASCTENGDVGFGLYWDTPAGARNYGHILTRCTSTGNVGEGMTAQATDVQLNDCVVTGGTNKRGLVIQGNSVIVNGGTYTGGSNRRGLEAEAGTGSPTNQDNWVNGATVDGGLKDWDDTLTTLGKTTDGSSTYTLPANGVCVSKHVCHGHLTVTKGYAFLAGTGSGSTSQKVRMVIFDAAAAVMRTSNEVTITKNAAASWVEFTFASTVLTPGVNYAVGLWGGANTNVVQGRYDAAGGEDYNGTATYHSTNNPSVGGWSAGGYANYAMYLAA